MYVQSHFVQLGSSLSIGFGNFPLRLRVTIFFEECVKLVELGSLTDSIGAGGGECSSTEGTPQYPHQIPQSHERERIQYVGDSIGRRHLPFVLDMNKEQSLQLSPQKSVDLTTRQILQSAEMEASLHRDVHHSYLSASPLILDSLP